MSRRGISGRGAAAIAASVEQALQAGRLTHDDRLPPIRELAASLRVSPVTVAAAYRMLRARGLAAGQGRRGTRLRPLPQTSPLPPGANPSSGLIDLAAGNPDPAFLPPLDAALRAVGASHRLYGESLELPALAAFAAAEFTADSIAPVGPIAVTSGGLDGIERVLREHLRVGDGVAVEDPTFPALIALLASLGLTPEPLSLDDEGPRPDSLDRALRRKVRALVISPRAQNPTGAAMTPARAADLSRILRRRPDVLVVEADDAGPVSGASLVSLGAGGGHWALIRSTSKFLGPDLRVAVMIGDAVTIARVQRRQAVGIRWVSHILQELALALWSDPSSGRRLAHAAEAYASRRSALIASLASHGIEAHGRSGFNVWIPVRGETPIVQALAARGWAVAPGERFRIESRPAIRVTASTITPEQAERFAADLAAAGAPAATSLEG